MILSVLMTAEHFDSYLLIEGPDGAIWSNMTFPGSKLRLEIPLITSLQQSRSGNALAVLRDLGLDARISRNDGDTDALVCALGGSPADAATVIKKLFAELYDAEETTLLEFRIFAHWLDQGVIDRALDENRPGDSVALPVAASSVVISEGKRLPNYREQTNGCMMALAGILLLPTLFMAAYLEFGYPAASAVLVIAIVSREVYRRWKKSKIGFGYIDSIKIIILGLVCATMYFNDPIYLQIMPTIVFCVSAIIEISLISFGMPPLLKYSEPLLKRGRLLFCFAIVSTCIGGAALNEYLRAALTLDAWMWFFAFARIELFLGFVASSIPLLVYKSKRIGKDVDDENGTTADVNAE